MTALKGSNDARLRMATARIQAHAVKIPLSIRGVTVDLPILAQKPDGSYDPAINRSTLSRAPDVGPAGWNHVVLDILQRASEETPHERPFEYQNLLIVVPLDSLRSR